MKKSLKNPSHAKGILLVLLVVPITLGLWLLVNKLGYVGSTVALVSTVLAFFLYRFGAGKIDKKAFLPLILILLVSIAIAIYGSYIYTRYVAFQEAVGGSGGIFSAKFQSRLNANFSWSSLWFLYGKQIMFSLVFMLIGVGVFGYDLVKKDSK